MVDFYELLNVTRNATKEELVLAFARATVNLKTDNNLLNGFEILTKKPLRRLYDYSLNVPEEVGEVIQKALLRLSRKEIHLAINILNKGLGKFPKQREIMLSLCKLYTLANRAEESIGLLVSLYEEYPEDLEVVFTLGLVCNSLRDYSTSYTYLKSIYRNYNSDVEYLNVYADTCINLGKYRKAYWASIYNINSNHNSEYLPYSYVAFIIAQYYIDRSQLQDCAELFVNYVQGEGPDPSIIGDALKHFTYFILGKLMDNEMVMPLIDVLIKLYKRLGVKGKRTKIIVYALKLGLDCQKMMEDNIHEEIVALGKNYICLILAEVFPEINSSTYEIKILINKLDIINIYDITYPQVTHKLVDDYPHFARLIIDFIDDFYEQDLEELIDKYEDMYNGMFR